jgi:hypothetical protein
MLSGLTFAAPDQHHHVTPWLSNIIDFVILSWTWHGQILTEGSTLRTL